MANLNVTYEEMNDASHRLDAGRDSMTNTLTELKNLIDQLVAGGFQTQLASGAFQDTYEQFTSGTTQAVQGLDGMAKFLRGAATAMQNTDEQLARAIQQ
jgi:WXG100 family type VII secretion target